MNFWVFKCNPKQFDLSGRLADPNPVSNWRVKQHKDEIHAGDVAFVWETGTKQSIRAILRVMSEPREMAEAEWEQKFHSVRDTNVCHRVWVTIIQADLNLSVKELHRTSGLEDLLKGEFPIGTNFKVSRPEGEKIIELARLTVIDPLEVIEPTYLEGKVRTVFVNAYERNVQAREKCLAHHGTTCLACGINLGKLYGDIGADYVHVHHLKPLGTIRKSYRVDPIRDLVPVCPNCHAMLHRENPPLTIDELRQRMRRSAV